MALGASTVRSGVWTIGVSLSTRLLGLVGTMILTRFIAPFDYGEVSVALVLVLTASQFTALGVGVYTIAHPEAGRSEMFHASVIHVGLGLLASIVCLLIGPRFASTFGTPTFFRYVPGFVLANMCDRLSFMPERVMIRAVRFRTLSILRGSGELAFTVVSLALAAMGWGAESIVIANIARGLLKLAIFLAIVPWRDWAEPHRLQGKTIRTILHFSGFIYVGGLANYLSKRWDNLLVSHFFGPAVMGAYNLSYNLAELPVAHIGDQISDVLQASFATMPKDERRAGFQQAMGVLMLVMTPLSVGLGAVAPSAAAAFFDKRWADVGPMLLLLSGLALARPVSSFVVSYMQILKVPRMVALSEVVSLAVLMGLLAGVGRVSPLWACATVGLAGSLRFPIATFFLQQVPGTSARGVAVLLAGPVFACVPLVAAVFGVRHLVITLGGLSARLSLPLEILAGGLAYAVAIWFFAPKRSRQIFALARPRLQRVLGRI